MNNILKIIKKFTILILLFYVTDHYTVLDQIQRNSIYRFINQALNNKKMVFKGKAGSRREFIHVEDAAESSVKILKPEYV